MIKNGFLFILMGLVFSFHAQAQTCCSGGVPLANNVGSMPLAAKGHLQLSASYDLNNLQTLKDGSQVIDDASRTRITHSWLFRSNYAFSKRFSLEAVLSYVQQERVIAQNGFEDLTQTAGPGDAIIMAQYQYLQGKNISLVIGAGPKIPTGRSDLKDDRGITLNADLQPGSGAWDGIFHHRLQWNAPGRKSMILSSILNLRITGNNYDYLGIQTYQFGNEIQWLNGLNDQLLIGKQLLNLGINFRYRKAFADQVDGSELPNTGGEWLFMMPAISFPLNQQISFASNFEIPIYAYTEGTQLSPTFRLNFSLNLNLDLLKNQSFELNIDEL